MSPFRLAFDPGRHDLATSFGLLLLRLAAGGFMVYAHGWGKLTGFSDRAATFSDPLGVGSELSLALAVFGEVVCAAAIALGLATRAAALPAITTMAVAAFVVHGDDPFGKKELALLYLVPYVTLLLTGAGSLSLDALVGKRR